MLAVGVLGAGSQLGKRIETLLLRGRTFTARASTLSVIASIVALVGLVICGALMPRWIAFAQEARATFGVASIKASKCEPNISPVALSPDRLSLPCRAVRDLIEQAYGKRVRSPLRTNVLGGPAWIDSEVWDIEAKASGAHSRSEMNGPMMQRLLEDRFRLRIHRETRIVPIYELTVAKAGPKLQVSRQGSCTQIDRDNPPPLADLSERVCGTGFFGESRVEIWGATMADLSDFLWTRMDRDVIDRTGISGRYDINLKIQPNPNPDPPDVAPAAPGSTPGYSVVVRRTYDRMVPPAVEQQLGLKLISTTVPDEFIVVDHIERPSPN